MREESEPKAQRDCATSGSTRNLSYDATRTHRACAQVLSELRRMIDRCSTPSRPRPTIKDAEICQMSVLHDPKREVPQNHGAGVCGTRAV